MAAMKTCRPACIAAIAATALCGAAGALADPLPAPGALLRQGEWGGGVGTYLIPAPFEGRAARQWPMAGWATLMLDEKAATLTIRPLSEAEARSKLAPIIDQVRRAAAGIEPTDLQAPAQDIPADLYVRVPGVAWKAASVPIQRFRNGTTSLQPELGYRFQMRLGDTPYAFTVQNGFRTADGRPYGSGVQFTLEFDGQRFEYDLGGYGWDVTLRALGDFDGDGRPDFLFSIGGSNSSHEALVLSSRARPGTNPPTAYLTGVGC